MSFFNNKIKVTSFRTQLEAGARLSKVRPGAQLLKALAGNTLQPLQRAAPSSGFCLKTEHQEKVLSGVLFCEAQSS